MSKEMIMTMVTCTRCGRCQHIKLMRPLGYMHKKDFVTVFNMFICKGGCFPKAKMQTVSSRGVDTA